MECNRDEAMQAKILADEKLEQKDFTAAKNFVLRAQSLYPNLEGISQMLTTIDIYISAMNKVGGEVDWYGVLGIKPTDDDETLKKQYRKLALALHPDKNKSAGADGAFKLLCEGWSCLSDKSKRLAYDQRRSSGIEFQRNVSVNPSSSTAPPRRNVIHNYASRAGTSTASKSRVHPASVPRPSSQRSDTFWAICHKSAEETAKAKAKAKYCPSVTVMADEDPSLEWDSDLELVSDSEPPSFDKDHHIRFLMMMFDLLPSQYQSQEINRLTLAYFAVVGLDILSSLDHIDKSGLITWVLSLQAYPSNEDDLNNGQFYGFHGSRSAQFESVDERLSVPNWSHLASTYCALVILLTLGYDLSLLKCSSILRSMKNLQQSDGSFMPIHSGAETADLRFVFCAVAICFMLHDWSGMDKVKAMEYIINCQSYDGGFSLVPGSESHGGATYCAVSSLRLMGFFEDGLVSHYTLPCVIDVPMLLNWCLQRQGTDGGYQGRPNKDSDTCYAFWVGGVLKILGAYRFTDEKSLQKFLLTCQTKYGGFSKFPGQLPDLYHSYYGICALSLLEEPGLKSVNVMLGMTDIVALGLCL